MAELVTREVMLDKSAIKGFFSEVQEELEEHLQTINENTSEIQSNHAYMYGLDNKIAKLNEKIDAIHNILSSFTGKKMRKMPAFEDLDPLSKKEQAVFLNIYAENTPMTYSALAAKMNMPLETARQYILNLIEKGIPIQRIYKNTRPHIYLDPKFKNLQAKENILKIEQKILM